MIKRTFEQYINKIEFTLDIRLLEWQKTILRDIYDGKQVVYSGRSNGKTVLYKAARMLNKEMRIDMGGLPPRLYELDSDEFKQ